jgi:hypothetical protein
MREREERELFSLKAEAAVSSEMLITIYETTSNHTIKYINLYITSVVQFRFRCNNFQQL